MSGVILPVLSIIGNLVPNPEALVQTNYGPVRGSVVVGPQTYISFRGIPYAKPPIGNLRFRDPQLPEPWTTTFDATDTGHVPYATDISQENIELNASEDCLRLNVYTRSPKQKLRPVLVWIFGGGFIFGQATMYGPDFLMREDIVVVTVNYRVGALGFMSIDDSFYKIPGNAGLKDQTFALKWVKQNIVKFGGDPNHITVAGESAGGASVNYHLVSDFSKNLFHQAIIMSGSVFAPWALTNSNEMAPRLAKKLGWNGLGGTAALMKVLMAADPADIVRQQATLPTNEEKLHGQIFSFVPVVESYDNAGSSFLRKHPSELVDQAWSKKLPVLSGGNSGEGFFFFKMISELADVIGNPNLLQMLLPSEITEKYPLNDPVRLLLADKVKTFYNIDMPVTSGSLTQIIPLWTDRLFWHGIKKNIESRVNGTGLAAPTYCYHFNYDSLVLLFFKTLYAGKVIRGTMHAEELLYTFNFMDLNLLLPPEEAMISNRMTKMLGQFVKTGNPNTVDTSGLNWKPIESTDNPLKCLSFDRKFSLIDLPETGGIALWEEIFSYA